MAKLHIKKGDTVIVLSGASKNVIGEVLEVSPSEGKVIVKGAHIVHKHVKPRRQGETGSIIETEGAIYASKVALYCSKCGKGVRSTIKVEGDKKVRVCSKCGQKI